MNDEEAYCPGCDGGMGDWFPTSLAEVCADCGEPTCPEHRKPRQHGCREMQELREMDADAEAAGRKIGLLP